MTGRPIRAGSWERASVYRGMDAAGLKREIRPSAGLRRLVEAYFKDELDCREGLRWDLLKGDGSDRVFYRVGVEGFSVVAMEYPNQKSMNKGGSEALSFFTIGSHLREREIPVPVIYRSQVESGWFVLEDLGDLTLQDAVMTLGEKGRLDLYKNILDLLVSMQIKGSEGFDQTWCYQSQRYDRQLMLQGEAGYFLREFVRDWMGLFPDEAMLWREFQRLADQASKAPARWFLHRDFQSRNIMIKDGSVRVIDFQGGRLGPLQYDTASLLNDPYVGLEEKTKERLVTHYLGLLVERSHLGSKTFLPYYDHIALHRNLQVLGAFSFLSRKKGLRYFEEFIPQAVRSLSGTIKKHPEWSCPTLRSLVDEIEDALQEKGRFQRPQSS